MSSSLVTRSSAIFLFAAGFLLLFASDVILPMAVPGFPTSASWLGQFVAAAWLGVAAMNWLQKTAVLGGIYGRPLVLANLGLYFISALSLLRPLIRGTAPALLWLFFVPAAALAIAYAALLLRGPFEPLRKQES